MSYFCIGMVRGFSAPAVPSMDQLNPGLLPTHDIASWASAIPPLGAFFGSLSAGPLMHYAGRKFAISVSSPIWATAWAMIAVANSWQLIIVARAICGFCVGLCLPSAQIYVSECSDPKIRGVIGSLPAIFMSCGVLASYIIGTFMSWNYLAWVSGGIAMFLTILVLLLPESPVWLREQNRIEEATRAVEWLHLQQITRKEIQTVEQNVSNDMYPKFDIEKSSINLMSRPILMPLLIGLVLLSIQQLSGIDAVIFFTVEIFRASGSSIDGNLATIIVGAVQLVSNIASLFVVDRYGRKPLLLISGIIMCLSMCSMGVAFYLNESNNHNFGFLPLLSLIVFMIGFSFGFGCIPFLLMGEIFPAAQRSFLSSIAGSFNLGIMFIVIKTYHPLEHVITTAGTFWMYSSLCAIGVLFVIAFVPETKGRDLDSIAKLFENPLNTSQLMEEKPISSKKNSIASATANIMQGPNAGSIPASEHQTKV